MTITAGEGLDRERWSSFVAANADGNVFQTPEMFEVFRRARGYEPSVWSAGDEEGPLALLVPVRVSVGGRLAGLLSTRAVVYGGLLARAGLDGDHLAAALDALLGAYDRRVGGAIFTELRNVADATVLRPALERRGYRFEEHLNFLIDLDRPPDAILAGMHERARRLIRQGLRDDTVRIADVGDDEAGRRAAYDLLAATYARAGVPLADRSLFEAAHDVLSGPGMVRFWLATVDGRPAASQVALLHGTRILAWYGGSDRALARHRPNELLTWHMLTWGQANGYRVFDFGGAGRPDEPYGPRAFKEKFGGQLVNYGRFVRVHAPVRFRVAKSAYGLYRRVAAARGGGAG